MARWVAFRGAPADSAARLKAMGLTLKGQSVPFGEVLVLREGSDSPWQRVAEQLGCREVFELETDFKPDPPGGELRVDWSISRRVDGVWRAETTVEDVRELAEDDLRGPPRDVAEQQGLALLEELLDLASPPVIWTLTVPRGWRPPDPLASGSVGEVVACWVGPGGRLDLPQGVLDWLTRALDTSGQLDPTPPPDLERWERRLLARHGSREAPGYAADWRERTAGDRARPAARPHQVSAWKLGTLPAILSQAEVAALAELLARPGVRAPALVPALNALQALVSGGGPLETQPTAAGR